LFFNERSWAKRFFSYQNYRVCIFFLNR
jgi:hypothetical protein